MGDKPISELTAAEQITYEDLFLLEQGGTAKKLPGRVLVAFLTALADGHGGIVKLEKTGSEGLVDTHKVTLADGSSYEFTVTNGEKGDKGDNAYAWIKYASQEPTAESNSMGDLPDDWMGIYTGPLDAAPEDWTLYKWFQIKGKTGDTGAPAALVSASVTYQVGTSATEIPTGEWTEAIPEAPQGAYLWSKTEYVFNSGDPAVVYAVSRNGYDGLGTLRTINGFDADESGNLILSADSVGALSKTGDTLEGALNANGNAVTGLPTPENATDAVPYKAVKSLRRTVWTNSGTSSEFAAQTLKIAISDQLMAAASALYIVISFWVSTDAGNVLAVSGEIPVSYTANTTVVPAYRNYGANSPTLTLYRDVKAWRVPDENSINVYFSAGMGGNTVMIPAQIDILREVE